MENGDERPAELVVGADGNGSRVRESINGSRWADYVVESGIRRLLEQRDGDPEDTRTGTWDRHWRRMQTPRTSGPDHMFLGARDGEHSTHRPAERKTWKDTIA